MLFWHTKTMAFNLWDLLAALTVNDIKNGCIIFKIDWVFRREIPFCLPVF